MTMTFETQALKDACEADQNILNKLTVIRTDAPDYGTPGPTALDANAKHAHVYNAVGVAWVYRGTLAAPQPHILALGRKNDKASAGNSKYDWSKKGVY